MDPNTALENARKAIEKWREEASEEKASDAAAEAFEALDGWLVNGGFLPQSWNRQ